MSGVEIRPYGIEHRQGVAELIVSIQRGEFGIDITYEQQPDLADIPGFYQRDGGAFWVAVADERVVGSVALLDIGEGEGALRKMFVAAEYRGADKGIAGRLLAALLDHGRDKGFRTLFLGTTDRFLAAHRFYEKAGFSQVDPAELPPSFPRMVVDSRFYRLHLPHT